MTALGTSTVWATMAHGIFTELYFPAVDQPQVKDFGFLVAAQGWWREVKRVDSYTLSTPGPALVLPTIVHTSTDPAAAYQLTLQPVVDPVNNAVLIAYDLQGDGVSLYPLLAPHLGICQPANGPQAGLGADNSGWVDPADQTMFAVGSGHYLCLLAAPGFSRAGVGYVGDTDGWTDFNRNTSMTLTYTQAGPGVVALTGELAGGSGLLAVGFADSQDAARAAAQASLDAGYPATCAAFTQGWQAWAADLTLPAPTAPAGLADALRQSAVVLRTHADHTVAGALVAGLAIPWGNVTNDPGGYHMVWCRDGGETALALAVAGYPDEAAATLGYLISQQNPADGSWPRCFFITGTNTRMPGAVQLDEVAFPLLLAGKLAEMGVTLPVGTDDAVRLAAGYLAANGPVSNQDVDRWEENAGASAFTIGLEIVALLVAASRLTGSDQALALALADNWNERLEEFTYIAGDELDQVFGTDGHYVRIGLAGGGRVTLGNQPPGAPAFIDAAALVGMEFLYLPRLGLRGPEDKRITDTLTVVEAMIGTDTPSGRTYHRYDIDGYGEWLDGSGWPVRGFGIGRPWPLLAGERGHYDVLTGGSASTQLQAMLAMRGRGGLLPEQVWDTNPLPWQYLRPGKPTGSAMPLAWAHSELIKLAVAASTGRPAEMLTLVSDRYQHAAVPTSASWFWRDTTPVRALPAGRTLVVAGTGQFTLHYGFDEWNPATIAERAAQPLGLGLFGVTLAPADLAGHVSLQFVRRYPDGSWEPATRNDVALAAPAPAAVHLSPAHLGAIAAAGPTSPDPELQ